MSEDEQEPTIDPYSWATYVLDGVVPRAVQAILNQYARLAHSAGTPLIQDGMIESLSEHLQDYQTLGDLQQGLLHSRAETHLVALYFAMLALCEDLQGSTQPVPKDAMQVVWLAVRRQLEDGGDAQSSQR